MSGQIRMSPEELDSRANGYGQGAEQIRVTLQQLQQLQEVLRGEWEGQLLENLTPNSSN